MPIKASLALIAGAVMLAAVPAAAQDDPRSTDPSLALACGVANLVLAQNTRLDDNPRQAWNAERANMWLNLYLEKTGQDADHLRTRVQGFITGWLGADVLDGRMLSPGEVGPIDRYRDDLCSPYGG